MWHCLVPCNSNIYWCLIVSSVCLEMLVVTKQGRKCSAFHGTLRIFTNLMEVQLDPILSQVNLDHTHPHTIILYDLLTTYFSPLEV